MYTEYTTEEKNLYSCKDGGSADNMKQQLATYPTRRQGRNVCYDKELQLHHLYIRAKELREEVLEFPFSRYTDNITAFLATSLNYE